MIVILFFFIVFYQPIQSQEFPQDFFEYNTQKYEYDIGYNWMNNSTLDPFSFEQYVK